MNVGTFCIVFFGVYIGLLTLIIRKWIKVKNNPEYYDNMEAIFKSFPRYRNLTYREIEGIAGREYGFILIVPMLIGWIGGMLLYYIWYDIKVSWLPVNALFISSKSEFDVLFILLVGGICIGWSFYCLLVFTKSGFWQLISVMCSIKEGFKKSRTIMRHLASMGILWGIFLLVYFFELFNYQYITETVLVDNFYWQQETYCYDEISCLKMEYKTIESSKYGNSVEAYGSLITKSGEEVHIRNGIRWKSAQEFAEYLTNYDVKIIKPEMDENEYQRLQEYDGEWLLEAFYPEWCEDEGKK